MIKRFLPVFLALVIVGCSSSSPESVSNESDTAVESAVNDNSLESEEFTTISVGDYTVEIPSSWSNEGDYYYSGDVGTLPYVYITLSDDFDIDMLLEDSDGFIEGSFDVFEDAKLTSGMSPVDYDYASGYSYSFSGTIQGYDTNNIFTFFENPSGGVVNIALMEEGFDSLPQYYAILNTVKSDIPVQDREEIPSVETASESVPEEVHEEEESKAGDTAESSSSEPVSSAPSAGESNALSKAKSYLSFSNFSYSGLIEQLEYEGFSHEEAEYGADHCGADWKEQALQKANDYLDISAFSYSGLIEQLEYEGFSHEEAEYGADQCGANWKEQAVKKAADYLEYSSFSRDGLIDQLEYEGFTPEEAEYGVAQSYD
jgi:SOS response regulatory protein OraA/RecX